MKKFLLFFTIIGSLMFWSSCDKEQNFTTSSNDKLEFSVDTLFFDTVFTQVGSATQFFKVYNRAKESIRISQLRLAEGANSKFNLNVDGVPGDEFEEVIVLPEDSIYVFAEVTIDPDQDISSSPFVLHEQILFETNGNEQFVTLEAWGQNANYIPNRFSKDDVTFLTCNNDEIVWNDPKPYVIYGIVVVENCKLVIEAGTRIHVHGGIAKTVDPDNMETVIFNTGRLQIGANASIEVNGTLEDPVIFEGDRLEEDFDDASGQWVGIVFSQSSQNNSFDNAIIKNSLLGMWVDSAAQVSLKNTQIYNTSGVGLVGIHSTIDADNSIIYNNGSTSALLTYGGNYDFNYCTIASYGADAAALSLSNGIRLDEFNPCNAFVYNDLEANFTNCIIFGSRRDEISLTNFAACGVIVDFDYNFENCVVRVDELVDEDAFPNFFDNCEPCINGNSLDALFADPNEDNYHLDTLSIAEEMAKPINGIIIDLDGVARDNQNPDIGCYEYIVE